MLHYSANVLFIYQVSIISSIFKPITCSVLLTEIHVRDRLVIKGKVDILRREVYYQKRNLESSDEGGESERCSETLTF